MVSQVAMMDAMVAHPWLTLVSTTVRLTTYVEEGKRKSKGGKSERDRKRRERQRKHPTIPRHLL